MSKIVLKDKVTGAELPYDSADPDDARALQKALSSNEYEIVSGAVPLQTEHGQISVDPPTATDMLRRGRGVVSDTTDVAASAENKAYASENERERGFLEKAALGVAGLAVGAADIPLLGGASSLQTYLSEGSPEAEAAQAWQRPFKLAGNVAGIAGTLGAGALARGGAQGAKLALARGGVGLTEKLGAAVGKRLGTGVASKVVQYGVEGGTQAATQSFLDALGNRKDVGEALISAGKGGAFGAALGGGIGGIVGAVSRGRALTAAKNFDALPLAGKHADNLNQQTISALDDLDSMAAGPKPWAGPKDAYAGDVLAPQGYAEDIVESQLKIVRNTPSALARLSEEQQKFIRNPKLMDELDALGVTDPKAADTLRRQIQTVLGQAEPPAPLISAAENMSARTAIKENDELLTAMGRPQRRSPVTNPAAEAAIAEMKAAKRARADELFSEAKTDPALGGPALLPHEVVVSVDRAFVRQLRKQLENPALLADLSPGAATLQVKKLAALEAAIENAASLQQSTVALDRLKEIRTKLATGFKEILDGSDEAVKANLSDTTFARLVGIKNADKYAHSTLAKAYMNAYGSRRLAAGHRVVDDVANATAETIDSAPPGFRRDLRRAYLTTQRIYNAVSGRGGMLRTAINLALTGTRGVTYPVWKPLSTGVGSKLGTLAGIPLAKEGVLAAIRFMDPVDVDYKGQRSAFRKRLAELNTVATTPGYALDRFEQQLGIRGVNATVSGQIAQKHVDTALHLQSKAPQPPVGLRYGQRWEPSATELATFNRHVTAAVDPFSVLANPARATQEHAETLWSVHPETMSDFRNGVLADEKKLSKLDYTTTFGLSVLLRIPLDPTLQPENKDVFLSIFKNDTGAGQPAAQPQQSKSAANEYTVGQTIGAK